MPPELWALLAVVFFLGGFLAYRRGLVWGLVGALPSLPFLVEGYKMLRSGTALAIPGTVLLAIGIWVVIAGVLGAVAGALIRRFVRRRPRRRRRGRA